MYHFAEIQGLCLEAERLLRQGDASIVYVRSVFLAHNKALLEVDRRVTRKVWVRIFLLLPVRRKIITIENNTHRVILQTITGVYPKMCYGKLDDVIDLRIELP